MVNCKNNQIVGIHCLEVFDNRKKCVSPQCQAHLENMGFNEHGFRSGGMFLHINMQDECVICDWNDYHQPNHIVGWGFTQILSKAPTRKAKSPTFFSVTIW